MRHNSKFITNPKSKESPASTGLNVFLLAASSEKKFRSKAVSCLDFNNHKKLIDYQVTAIRQTWSDADIYVVVGHDSESAIKYIRGKYPFVKIVENQTYNDNNNVKSLSLAIIAAESRSKYLVINGDLYFNKRYLETISLDSSCVICETLGHITKDEIGMTVVDGMATYFCHGLDKIWGQMVLLQGKEKEIVTKLSLDKTNHKKHLYEILNVSVDIGAVYNVRDNTSGKVHEFDNLRDIEKFNANISTF